MEFQNNNVECYVFAELSLLKLTRHINHLLYTHCEYIGQNFIFNSYIGKFKKRDFELLLGKEETRFYFAYEDKCNQDVESKRMSKDVLKFITTNKVYIEKIDIDNFIMIPCSEIENSHYSVTFRRANEFKEPAKSCEYLLHILNRLYIRYDYFDKVLSNCNFETLPDDVESINTTFECINTNKKYDNLPITLKQITIRKNYTRQNGYISSTRMTDGQIMQCFPKVPFGCKIIIE